MFKKTILTLGLAVLVAPAMAALEWTSDLDGAKQKAKAEQKALLLDFTGSDWCGWCIRLRKDVLSRPEFEAYAADKFIPVEIDMPQNPNFDKELKARNAALCEKYHVSGFPTIIVVTPEGTVAGGFSGGRDDVKVVLPILDVAVDNLAKLKEAETQEGVAKAETLVKVYNSLCPELKEAAAEMRDTIVALDPEDKSGLRRAKAVDDEAREVIQQLMDTKTPAEAKELIEKLLTTVMPENRVNLLRTKSRLLLMTAETLEDVQAARAAALAAAAENKVDGEAEKQTAERAYADPEAMLERVKKLRAQQEAAAAEPKKK